MKLLVNEGYFFYYTDNQSFSLAKNVVIEISFSYDQNITIVKPVCLVQRVLCTVCTYVQNVLFVLDKNCMYRLTSSKTECTV